MNLVVLEWIDAHSRNQWTRIDEIRGDGTPLRCRSVGWELRRDKGTAGHTTLCSSLSGEKNEGLVVFGSGDITIPNRCITKRTVIRGG